MSDHEWADEEQQLDSSLGKLFADVRPSLSLDDETIHALRGTSTRRFAFTGWRRKFAAGIAASIMLGATGAVMSQFMDANELPFPGQVSVGQNLIESAATASRLQRDSQVATSNLSNTSIPVRRVPDEVGDSSPTKDVNAIAQEFSERARRSTLNSQGDRTVIAYGKIDVDGSTRGDSQKVDRESPLQLNGRYAARDEKEIARLSEDDALRTEGKPRSPAAPNVNAPNQPQPGPIFYGGYANPSDLKPGLPTPARPAPQANYIAAPRGGDIIIHDPAHKNPRGGSFTSDLDSALLALEKKGKEGASTTIAAQEPEAPRKIVIRSGDIEFEVESFDSAVATVTKLVTDIKGAFVGTVNSDKLPNGKVKGAMVVRVPPEHLDALVLDLRKELGKSGELKRLKIGSQDITKQYTDLESRLKAARTMEQRLLQIIKDGKGEIKQLLEAEKELGVWRTKIEEFEGELKYYGNLVSLSTLTITMAEKEIRSAAVLTENERIQAGVEVEDVEQARQQALAAIAEVKGRVIKSELKQLAAGQFNATLQFEVAPDSAGPIRDRLRQLGRMTRLEIDRVQQAEGGTVPRDAKVIRGDTQFSIQLFNLANVAPRDTATLQLAVVDVPAGYQGLRDAVEKAKGRVLTARLDEQDRQNIVAQLDFEVRRADEAAIQTALASAGDVTTRNVTRAPDSENVTDSKVLFRVSLVNAARLKPRELVSLAMEVPDVDKAMTVFGALVNESKGRVVDSQVAHEQAGRVTARVVYDVPLAAAPALVEKLSGSGIVRMHQSSKDLQAPDGRYATARLDVTLSNTDLIVAKDAGLWTQVRRGLAYSASVLLLSVTWIVFGLCVVLPWLIIGYAGYRLVRRLFGGGSVVSQPVGPG